MNYSLEGVSIQPVTTKIQVSYLTQQPERKETAQAFHHEANGDIKTVTEFNCCEKRKLRMDQQHWQAAYNPTSQCWFASEAM
jgi:hypothetical protein